MALPTPTGRTTNRQPIGGSISSPVMDAQQLPVNDSESHGTDHREGSVTAGNDDSEEDIHTDLSAGRQQPFPEPAIHESPPEDDREGSSSAGTPTPLTTTPTMSSVAIPSLSATGSTIEVLPVEGPGSWRAAESVVGQQPRAQPIGQQQRLQQPPQSGQGQEQGGPPLPIVTPTPGATPSMSTMTAIARSPSPPLAAAPVVDHSIFSPNLVSALGDFDSNVGDMLFRRESSLNFERDFAAWFDPESATPEKPLVNGHSTSPSRSPTPDIFPSSRL
ncbi:hypothetical protein GY45DRAFT_1336077 [Cubamyces sp. BRFM 1775]|nr:hypothetical protein GY45DRAFT_1336077 [Cubamyces sp. BRFM 1775]